MNVSELAAASHQINAPAVCVATISTGMVTLLEWIPPLAGALSSIGGVILLYYLIKHKRLQIKIDEKNLEE